MKKLTIRNLLINDLERVKEIHYNNKNDFPFPDLLNKLYCWSNVVEDESGQIIGVGIVRLTSESILIVDNLKEKVTRSLALKMLIDKMKRDVKVIGMDETHVFVNKSNSKLKRLLMKAFGFIECEDQSLFMQF